MANNIAALTEINHYLEQFNGLDIEPVFEPDLFFIIGAPRSGSTLIYQALAQCLELGFPNNFIARFWGNPVIGYLLYREIYGAQNFCSTFNSYHGYSGHSVHEPHEFGYFWSRWFDHSHSHYTSPSDLISSELKIILGSLQKLSGSPWLFKNLTLGLKILAIKKFLPKAKFVVVCRDPEEIAFSLLRGRRERFKDDRMWWSLKPKEIDSIKNHCAEEQVVAQVYYCYNQIFTDITTIPFSDYYILRYEEFCESPDRVVQKLADFWSLRKACELPRKFEMKKKIIPDNLQSQVRYYFDSFDFSEFLCT